MVPTTDTLPSVGHLAWVSERQGHWHWLQWVGGRGWSYCEVICKGAIKKEKTPVLRAQVLRAQVHRAQVLRAQVHRAQSSGAQSSAAGEQEKWPRLSSKEAGFVSPCSGGLGTWPSMMIF